MFLLSRYVKVFFILLFFSFMMFSLFSVKAEDKFILAANDVSSVRDMGCIKDNVDIYKTNYILSRIKVVTPEIEASDSREPITHISDWGKVGILLYVDDVWYLFSYRRLYELYSPDCDLSRFAPDDIVFVKFILDGYRFRVIEASCASEPDAKLYLRQWDAGY